ncbi:alkaline phosphatase [Corynebacterium sp. CCM 8862]|uniref:Alkaline phosphatase n=1 Tax=Corynebacterium mendelii TaxID=2765362 RepID=A0A939IUR5_9CORY|nr:alkaline phosphatase [Corynebacterium mendelii]MBN9645214.1 alkaline phosphatase [Corynebacterium mendelii]
MPREVTALVAAALIAGTPTIAAAAPAIDPADTSPVLKYNGPATCKTRDGQGHVVAPGPGACAQYGTVGEQRSDTKARNVILVIGDGMGQQEITAARNYLKGAAGRFEGLDSFTATGAYTHHSINQDGSFNYVTDSAASATAWSTGTKTYNGAIGVDLLGNPVMTLLEKAKKAGMRTGNVTTSEIQDATPAGAATHALNRKCYGPQAEDNATTCRGEAFDKQYRDNGGLGSIEEQMIDLRPDVTLGGGAKHFQQEVKFDGVATTAFTGPGAKWTAGKTVLDNAKDNGFQVVTTADELARVDKADQEQPLLGLFHDKNMTTRFADFHATPGGAKEKPASCEKQDTGTEPELAAMAEKAIELLDDPDADTGFFLQVESASIDKRAHAADGCGMIGEVERLDETVQAALDFARRDGNTLVMVTADHAHSTEIIYDGVDSVSATQHLATGEGNGMTLAYGTIPADQAGDTSQQHNGSQLRVAAFGPGAENIIGQIDQTDMFFVMANALGLNDLPQVDPSPTAQLTASARAVDVSEDKRAQPADALSTCYKVGNAGFVSGPGDCAQFGKDGQGLDDAKAKNVIIFVGDGMGDSEITSARDYLTGANGRLTGIDQLPFTGYYTTFALDEKVGGPNYVTDSAASATGWASGTKTYNGGVGITVDGTPVPNLIELAKAKGMKTGNVTTAEIQDATPAVMGSHALNRKCYGPEEDKNKKTCQGEAFRGQYRENGGLGSIMEQLIDTRADVTFGGGASYFEQIVQVDGDWNGHRWTKGDSVLDNAKNQGFTVVTDIDGMNAVDKADQDTPVLGLFAEKNMPRLFAPSIPTLTGAKAPAVTCEKNPEFTDSVPPLAAMTAKALDLLDNDRGFLLQVESASIDKADHEADACGQIGEAWQLDRAIAYAKQWAIDHGDDTLIIVTADHAHTSQVVANGKLTAGRTINLATADGDTLTMNYATAPSNDDEKALGSQTHTGAQLRVAAYGPGAANVVGQIDQTDVHYVIANALGLYDNDPAIDLSPQWGKKAAAADTGGNRLLVVGILIAVLVLVGLVAFLATRRRTRTGH